MAELKENFMMDRLKDNRLPDLNFFYNLGFISLFEKSVGVHFSVFWECIIQ